MEPGELLGREAEVAVVDAFFDRVRQGSAALVIEGDPGIGKTTLWREATVRAERSGMCVLECRPAEAEAKLSFTALADLLEPVADDLLPRLPEPQRRALEAALLRVEPGESPLDPRAVAVAVHSLLTSLADASPVLVAVDDSQWLDRPSASALRFALRRIRRERIGLLEFRRPPGRTRPAPLQDVVENAEVVALDPLSLGAIHELVKRRLGRSLPRPLLTRVHELAGGNPFFALEIGRDVIETHIGPADPLPVPSDLSQLVLRRVARLQLFTREALLVAAAIAQPSGALITAALGADATEALDAAEEAGLVSIHGGVVRFSHPLYAAAVYSSASRSRRRALHRRLADVVSELEERARHLALGADGRDAEVADVLDAAARAARARGSAIAAAELEELAIQLTPPEKEEDRNERRLDLVDHLVHSGDGDHARHLLEELIESSPTLHVRARALLALAALRYWGEGSRAGVESCEQALEAASEDRALLAKCHADLAVYCDYDIVSSERHARIALALFEEEGVEQPDPHALSEALAVAARDSLVLGKGLPIGDVLRALELEAPPLPLSVVGRINTQFGQWLKYVDDFDGARARLERARAEAEEEGDDSSLPNILMHLAQTECWTGNWPRALDYAEQACELAEQLGQGFRGPQLYRAYVDAHLGNVPRARATATEGLAIAEASPLTAPLCLRVLGFLDLSLGRAAEAHEHLARALDFAEGVGIFEPGVFRVHADAVEALVALGKLESAAEVLGPWEEQAQEVRLAWSLATSARCRGLLAAAGGDFDRAFEALNKALAAHERLAMPFELGRTLLVRGQIERRAKRKGDAKASLERALGMFGQLGAPLWAQRARNELGRVGLRPSAPGELTSSERRVAELAATGLTNREVAATLFMSPKTVEANLARAYRKLGIRSRAQLGARLAGAGNAQA